MKKKQRNTIERRRHAIEIEKLNRANKKIAEAVELAVSRAIKEFSVDDLAARSMITDILRDHLFADMSVNDKSSDLSYEHNGLAPITDTDPVLEKTSGFDKSKWGAANGK